MIPTDDITVTIDEVAYSGKGVSRHNGRVVFTRGVIAGEHVRVRISKSFRDYDEATLIQVLEPAPTRITPECSLAIKPRGIRPGAYTVCPGCQYQHMTYEAECALKTTQLRKVLAHKAGIPEARIADILPSPIAMGYRNKIRLTAENDHGVVQLGYIHEDNELILDIEQCPLADPAINAHLAELRAKPGFMHSLHDRTSITFRRSHDGTPSHWRDKAVGDESWLKESTPFGVVSTPRSSFFQINPSASQLLIQTVQDLIKQASQTDILDAYCGVGIFALAAAAIGKKRVLAIDSDEAAITAATYNAKTLSLNASFMASPARDLHRLFKNDLEADNTLVVVDPPRSGLHAEVRTALRKANPAALIYVSCAPDTLARDLAEIRDSGYTIQSVQAVDMFPRTTHFESVAYLTRNP